MTEGLEVAGSTEHFLLPGAQECPGAALGWAVGGCLAASMVFWPNVLDSAPGAGLFLKLNAGIFPPLAGCYQT